MKKLLFLTFVLFATISCVNKNALPDGVLPKEKMQAVLWSMITAGEYLNAYVLKDSVDKIAESSKVYGEVFQIHHITGEQFNKSYKYYRQHPDLMRALMDSLSRKQAFSAERFQRAKDSTHRKLIDKAEPQ